MHGGRSKPISKSFALIAFFLVQHSQVARRFFLLQHGQVRRRFLLLQRPLTPRDRIELLTSFSWSEAKRSAESSEFCDVGSGADPGFLKGGWLVSSMVGSGGMPPREILKSQVSEMAFPAF